MLHAAVVREDAAQLEIGQLVDDLAERHRASPGRDATARPDRDVDDDIRDYARLFRSGGEVSRVLFLVDGLNEVAVGFSQVHRAPDLGSRRVGRRHQNLVDAVRHHRLSLAELGAADAD